MKRHVEFDIEFRRNPYKGRYLAIEGPDGSGKSTQAERLKDYFEKRDEQVLITHEPNDELVIGKFIRQILQGKVNVPSESIQYLMSADRADNHENVIYPALKDGKTVISHRNFWSAIPYGLLDKGIQTATTDRLHQLSVAYGILSMYHQFITPDKTLYLDISADTAVRRLLQRGSNAEMYEKKEKIEKIIAGYTLLLQEFPEEFVIFDAEKSIDDVTDDMIQEIEKNKFKK